MFLAHFSLIWTLNSLVLFTEFFWNHELSFNFIFCMVISIIWNFTYGLYSSTWVEKINICFCITFSDAISYFRVNIRLCPNLRCIRVQKYYEVFKSQSLTSIIRNSIRDISILWTMYDSTVLKLFNILITSLFTKYILSCKFVEFFDPI